MCPIDLFSIYAWFVPIKDKKGTSVVNAFKKTISKERKPKKTWVDKGGKFDNNSFKDFLNRLVERLRHVGELHIRRVGYRKRPEDAIQ